MPTLAAPKLTSWSYSRLTVYDKCPAQAKYKFILKLPENESPAMARGTAIHKLAEQYVKGEIKALPKELKLFASEFKSTYKGSGEKFTELDWAFTSAWKPTDWKDWTGAWVRVKVDLVHRLTPQEAVMKDYKTGKQGLQDQPGDRGVYEQLMLYATAGFKMLPELQEVHCVGEYLDHGVEKKETYTRKDLPKLVKHFDARSRPMMRDEVFKPTPSHACTWCAYSKAKNGPCQY